MAHGAWTSLGDQAQGQGSSMKTDTRRYFKMICIGFPLIVSGLILVKNCMQICFCVLWVVDFTHIHQGFFTGSGAIITSTRGGALTHYGQVTPYGVIELVNIGSGNGLVLSSTKPLPEPMMTYHQWGLVAFTCGQFHEKNSRYLSLTLISKSLI